MLKLSDIIFAILCGESLTFLIADLVKDFPVNIVYVYWACLILLPIVSVVCLWIAEKIAVKFPFVLQLAKYILIGVLATSVDLGIFDYLIASIGLNIIIITGVVKGLSFLIATAIKFLGNKFWVFEDRDGTNIKKEIVSFLFVTFIGFFIDIGGFFFFSKFIGPQLGFSADSWVKISVILAALIAVVWNFLGYKFIVFKKNDSIVPEI